MKLSSILLFALSACGPVDQMSDVGAENNQEAELTAGNDGHALEKKAVRLIEGYIDEVWVPCAGKTTEQRLQAIDSYVTEAAKFGTLAAEPYIPGLTARQTLAAILQSVVNLDPDTTLRLDASRPSKAWALKDGTVRVTSWTVISGINKNGYYVPNFGFIEGNDRPFAVGQQFVHSVAFPASGAPIITAIVGDTDFTDFLQDLGAI